MSDLALDRADIIEVSSEQWRRAQQDRLRLDISQPALTMYLVINSSKPELRDIRLRQAISWSIDRAAIHNVIYQRQGEIAGGLLPNWLTGYAFLFSSGPDLARAKQLVAEFGRVPQLTIGYDADDPQQRLIAERIALNVREAGIGMQAVASSGAGADIRLREIAINTSDAVAALDEVLTTLDLAPAAKSAALDALYGNERAALQTYMAIPLVHLPKVTALKDRIHNWTSSPAGEWELGGIWVTPRSINREGRP
jgi:ABC-type transport system substrate-binding protein